MNFHNWLGLLTHIFALSTSYLLLCWPSKSIQMQLCNYSSPKGMDLFSYSWKNWIPLWLAILKLESLPISYFIIFSGKKCLVLLAIHCYMWHLYKNQRFHMFFHWSTVSIANFHIKIRFLEKIFCQWYYFIKRIQCYLYI